MFYSPKFFSDNMPKWKKKKDPLLTRFFYRPLSFVCSSIASSLHISANAVSYFNVLVVLAAAVLFLFNNRVCAIVGASLINLWLLLDCTDGNIARSVRKQPYGEYADSISSYFLVPLMCISIGFYCFNVGGVLIEKEWIWIILIGVLAGLSDTMMRLVYHKYKEVTLHMIEMGVVEELKDTRNDHSKVNSLRVRIESDFGVGGILPLLTLFAVIFNFTDILLIYCLVYYGGSFIVTTGLSTLKAMKHGKKSFVDPEDKDVEIEEKDADSADKDKE